MKKLELVHVVVHPEGDGMEGLYLDGEQLVAGDEYHDHIGSYIKGVMHGLAAMGWDRSLKQWRAEGDYGSELMDAGEGMPEYLDEFDEQRIKKKRLNWGDY